MNKQAEECLNRQIEMLKTEGTLESIGLDGTLEFLAFQIEEQTKTKLDGFDHQQIKAHYYRALDEINQAKLFPEGYDDNPPDDVPLEAGDVNSNLKSLNITIGGQNERAN